MRENFLERLKLKLDHNNVLKSNKTILKFGNVNSDLPKINYLPINIKSERNVFKLFNSSVFFDNLSSKSLGKLLIYADIMGSTQNIFDR